MTRIDWPQLLSDIAYMLGEASAVNPNLRTPCGTRLLAKHLGVDREALRRWQNGAKIEYHEGMALLVAWEKATGKPRLFAPTGYVSFSAAKVAR